MAKLLQFGQRVVVGTPALLIRIAGKGGDVMTKAQPHLAKFWGNAKVEMAPPSPAEFPKIQKGFMEMKDSLLNGKFLDNSVKETAAKGLVAAEIAFWFYIGEIIGRKSLIGYNV
eukprot:Seg385.20 transcript_id=Seg385.20/GoldUCD/mRNA.D3Y31 product="ATP synthase subunit g mitochondrial" protein_id=Seg385.20/GoldUCD/D3Y31